MSRVNSLTSARRVALRSDVRRRGRGSRSQVAVRGANSNDVHSILNAVAHGRVDVGDAAKSIEEISSGLHAIRPAVPPVRVLDAPGMPAAQLALALENTALEQHTAAARRVSADMYASVRTHLPGVQYHGGAEMLLFTDVGAAVPKPPRLPGRVSIVCGYSSDVKAAYEAKVALEIMGGYCTMHQGVSAADLPSVLKVRESLADADAVIVCCGEQPSLAGLLSSMVAVPVIALPGVDRADPLSAMQVAGVSSVAPDDGVGAAAVAVRTLRVAAQYIQYRKDREARPPAQQDSMSHETYSKDSAQQPSKKSSGTFVLRNVVPSSTKTQRAGV